MSSTSNSAWASPRLSDQENEYAFRNNKAEMFSPTAKHNKIKKLRHPTDTFLILRLCQVLVGFVVNSTLFALCILLCVTVVPLVLFVRKVVVTCCVKVNSRYHGRLDAVNSCDALWLAPNNNTTSNIFFLLEGHINVEELRDYINDKMLYYCLTRKKHKFPKLRKLTVEVCSGFAWRQIENFQTDDFVSVSEHNNDSELNGLEALEGSCHLDQVNSNVDVNKLWKVTVFPKFLDSEDYGVLFQMHHSIADIYQFSRFVFESLGYKTVYLKDRCFPVQRLCLYFCTAFVGPLIIARRLLHSKAKTILDQRNIETQGESRHRKVFWSEAIDIKNIKKVKDISRTKGKN